MGFIRPRAIAVKPLDDYKIIVTFNNGENRIFDVKPYFDFKLFKELEGTELFQGVRVAGLSVEWPNGVDICPDELYLDSIPIN
ncbi:Protein of unknown function (DUF2442) [Desulfitobacterium dichloroeliminans LMG P-21439]|uniref:DUF2442 domain-containing protein n=1 Tax=Desulfitobacterium dichloroeliminans (strain LMG P-21439 / DCA1) TaxID=871963 RepID=L0FBI0_DESDL|nr:DUF2442 domain-containing protein [Desulfitobacterium dichloroeliminans]AGA70562.1 Protein of unknown function (DUF2442) [Desulfitobacterium dichloroeliminans LMG P-21439]